MSFSGPEGPKNILGMAIIAMFMLALTWLSRYAIPKENVTIVTYMIGQLSGFATAVVGAHYTMKARNRGKGGGDDTID